MTCPTPSSFSPKLCSAPSWPTSTPPSRHRTLTDPELIADRVHSAIAVIASMVPANAEECEIALRVVTADAQAKDNIRQARQLFNDPTPAMKCQAQASLMMRTANAARSMLLRVQTARRKREAIPPRRLQPGRLDHPRTEALLLDAAGHPTAAPPPPAPPPEPESEPKPPHVNDDNFIAQYDEAEQYALMYPRRAAEIRAYGGVPPTAGFFHRRGAETQRNSGPSPCARPSPARLTHRATRRP